MANKPPDAPASPGMFYWILEKLDKNELHNECMLYNRSKWNNSIRPANFDMKIQILLNYNISVNRFINETYEKINIQTNLVKREFISYSLFCANTAYWPLGEQVDVMKVRA